MSYISAISEAIDNSPSPFHVVRTATQLLVDAGYTHINYTDSMPTVPGKYVITRAGALIAVDTTHLVEGCPLRIVGAHTDSPNLRIKQYPHTYSSGVTKLLCEPYGGVILHTWLDRDLAIAGRIIGTPHSQSDKTGNITSEIKDAYDDTCIDGLTTTLVHTPAVVNIPSLAIHLSPERGNVNLDRQNHLNPLWSIGDTTPNLLQYLISLYPELAQQRILGFDLMLTDTVPTKRLGAEQEFITGPRFDNQISCFSAVYALIEQSLHAGKTQPRTVPMIALFDHEEVGSMSERGADSNMFMSLLERIYAAHGVNRADMLTVLTSSIMFSADNAHATHPNHPDRHEPSHHIAMGGGPVIKTNYNLRYATDGLSMAYFVKACREAGVPFQKYLHRADLACGSTIGPLSAAQTGIHTIDIGAPQLGMHSVRETMAAQDIDYFQQALSACLRLEV